MPFLEDGSVLTRRRWPWQRDTLAFGWLDPAHPFRQGACPPAVLAGLEESARRPVDQTRGYHVCAFCPPRTGTADQPWATLGPTPYVTRAGDTIDLGSASLEVVTGGRRGVAPNLVLHYVSEHGYLPPDEVGSALLAR